MERNVTDDPFALWWATTPENKLELIDGQLIISTLAGSRRVAWDLLHDFGPPIALPLAAAAFWWEALRLAFAPQPVPETPTAWSAWATQVAHTTEPAPAGPYGSLAHRRTYQLLRCGLSNVAEVSGLGRQLGRDFVMRLGENGLTPDLIFVDRARLLHLHEYYLDGPPVLVIEITLEGSADMDRHRKRQLYEQAGIPEYWLIEADAQDAVFWRLAADGRYHQVAVDSQGVYHSAAVPGLALAVPQLWTMDEPDWDQRWLPFLPVTRTDMSPLSARQRDPDDLYWDTLPFAPRVALNPVPIQFAEYISWCPEAKFERYGGGMVIGSHEGTRRVMGLLLLTFGLVQVVKLAHPREWVAFLTRHMHQATLQSHTAAIMAHAHYASHTSHGDAQFFYGTIPQLPQVSAYGDTRVECERHLADKVSDWVLLRIARQQEISHLE